MSTATQHDPAAWSFLIPAAGEGLRHGAGPKYLLPLDGEPLWHRAVRRALGVAREVVLAVPAEDLDGFMRRPGARQEGLRVVAGARTRQDSLAAALEASQAAHVLIHDVARPFASHELMREVACQAMQHGAAACVSTPDSPWVQVVDGRIAPGTAGGDRARLVHTPLAFRRDLLLQAYRSARDAGVVAASTVELATRGGLEIRAVEGDRRHFKITWPGDLAVAEQLARAWN